jgi:PmbA protein
MNGAELLDLAKSALAEAGEAEVEVCATETRRGFARFGGGEINEHMDLVDPQVVVRVAHGRRVAESSTTTATRASIVRAIRSAAVAATIVPETDGFPGFAGATADDADLPLRFAASTANTTADQRVALLMPALDAIRSAGLVSAGLLETSTSALAVATTAGCARSHDSTAATFKVWALETPGAGGAAGYGGQLSLDVDALDLRAEAERAIRIATMSRDPIMLDAGTYDVVMEPEAISELFEWLATTTFTAPEVEQGTSAVAGRAGARVTGEAITITEDPLQSGALGFAAPFDREGTSRRRVALVERGVARDVLLDRTYAARRSMLSTGSAAVGGGIGPCALTVDGGDATSVDELVSGVERGLYVCRLHYVNGLMDPRRTVMTGLTRDGCFLIEKGRITRPVGNMRFTDGFFDALARADGMTRRRVAVPTWWSAAGATVVPAVRMRAFRFNGASQRPPETA